jgi:outer membrane lipoprotein SlyB
MKISKIISSFILIALSLVTQVVSAQDWDTGAQSRARYETLSHGRVLEGVVVQTRNIAIQPTTTSNIASASIGGAIGAAIGSRIGGGQGRMLATTLGGIIGAATGKIAGDAFSGTQGQELIIRMNSGVLMSITQSESNLMPGQQVYLVESGGKIRVTSF